MDQRNVDLPALNKEANPHWKPSGHDFAPSLITASLGPLWLRPIKEPEELWYVEEHWRTAARAGDHFALDEFTEDGYFNRRLMATCDTFVLEYRGEIVGGALFGGSDLARASPSHLATCYIYIPPKYQMKGIATQTLRHFISVATELGYRCFLLDVLMDDVVKFRIIRGMGFTISGSLPYCAYMKNIGPVDSVLLYKDLENVKDSL